jgi:uncharacterized protein (DUF1919 family)
MSAISLPTPRAAPKPRVWEPVKLWRRRLAAKIMRARVTNRDFTIISNDCFGGMAYEELGRRYESPFVGLFVLPEDYIRLLRNLKPACERPIRFKEHSRHERINAWRQNIPQRDYPIGVVGDDVEVHFLHYANREAAEAKWTRRVERIHWDNLFVKICWHEEENMTSWLREFDAMPFARKLSLVPHEIPGIHSSVALRNYGTDGTWQYWSSHLHFDVAAWLNTGAIKKTAWTRPLDWLLYWHY